MMYFESYFLMSTSMLNIHFEYTKNCLKNFLVKYLDCTSILGQPIEIY